MSIKPLGKKAYGSIPHLPGSRLGPGDHHCHEGQAIICTERPRDRHDSITVTVKLDGSCVSVAKINGELVALGRAGWPAQSSPYEQHQLFAYWVRCEAHRFDSLLSNGERVVGEWLAQAHGTRYDLNGREPFVAFDIFDANNERLPTGTMREKAGGRHFTVPPILRHGETTIHNALSLLESYGRGYGEIDEPEGAVWRVERRGKFDFLAKYVRPSKFDGAYLPEISGGGAIWNWRPSDTSQPVV